MSTQFDLFSYLIGYFDSDMIKESIKIVAKQKPYFIMCNCPMANDSVVNSFVYYIFDTIRKVL